MPLAGLRLGLGWPVPPLDRLHLGDVAALFDQQPGRVEDLPGRGPWAHFGLATSAGLSCSTFSLNSVAFVGAVVTNDAGSVSTVTGQFGRSRIEAQ